MVVGGTVEGASGGETGTVVVGAEGATVVGAVTAGGCVSVAGGLVVESGSRCRKT